MLSLAGRVLPPAFLTTIWYLRGVLSSSFESTGLLVSITTSKALVLVPGYFIFTLAKNIFGALWQKTPKFRHLFPPKIISSRY